MHADVAKALEDPDLLMPYVPPAPTGMAWLRSSVARYSNGTVHKRRRALAEEILSSLSPADLRQRAASRTRELRGNGQDAAAIAHEVPVFVLGGPSVPVACVAAVAAAYHPDTGSGGDAELAVLVDFYGGSWDDLTAARISVLVQAYAATASLILNTVSLKTRRVTASGEVIVLDLAGSGMIFGAGAHACPGRAQAEAIAEGVRSA